jgi:hypothetical protein
MLRLPICRAALAALCIAYVLWIAGCRPEAPFPAESLPGEPQALNAPQSWEGNLPPTPTPFRPLSPTSGVFPSTTSTTPTYAFPTPTLSLDFHPPDLIQPPAAAQESSADSSYEPTLGYHGIDFSRPERIYIKIYPAGNQVNHGNPVKISFIPGFKCRFGDKHGCVYAYKPSYTGNVIMVTVHSGLGGEGQRWRSAIEGTGINRAGYKLDRVMENMNALSGARVVLQQGDRIFDTASLAVVSRIPARDLGSYFKVALADILAFAGTIDPHIEQWAQPDMPVIVLETCGWKMSGEPGSNQVSDTTGSVYLTVLH